jgi:hypothetical protein
LEACPTEKDGTVRSRALAGRSRVRCSLLALCFVSGCALLDEIEPARFRADAAPAVNGVQNEIREARAFLSLPADNFGSDGIMPRDVTIPPSSR